MSMKKYSKKVSKSEKLMSKWKKQEKIAMSQINHKLERDHTCQGVQ